MFKLAKYKSTKIFSIEEIDIFEMPIWIYSFWWASQEYKGVNYMVDIYKGTTLSANPRCSGVVRSINTI